MAEPHFDAACLFCRIAAGTIPVEPVYADERCVIFPDIHPQAPVHLLAIPRAHFADVTGPPAELLGHLLEAAARVAKERAPGGHRLVMNTGADAGQSVGHLHVHILGGRALGWPPG